MNQTQEITTTDVGITLGRKYQVVLFNDESHGMLEVVNQIRKAIHCSETEAARIMLVAHSSGRAVVITGGLERCELVESILAEIHLTTKIEEV